MYGVSFFGVTPGYTRRDFCSDDTLKLIIDQCSELHTLDQFTVTLPPNGTLYTFGGTMVGTLHVTFIGLRRHAIEYRGSREGGHYGVGIWLVDSWIGPDVVGFIDEMIAFLSDELVNAEGRVIRTFEQIDWSIAPAFLRKLGASKVESGPMSEDVFSEEMGRKFMLAPEKNAPPFSNYLLPQLVQLFRQEPVILRDRVIYTTSDPSVIRAVRELHRIDIIGYKDFFDQCERQRRASRPASVTIPRPAFASTDSNTLPDTPIPRTTIPVHDEYGENARRPSKKSITKSPDLIRSISGVFVQSLALLRENMTTIIAGVVLAIVIFLITEGPAILRIMRPRIVVTPLDTSTKSGPTAPEQMQGASNTTSSESELQCLKARIDTPGKDAQQKSIRSVEKRIKEEGMGYPLTLNSKELQAIVALIQRERDYLNCLRLQQ